MDAIPANTAFGPYTVKITPEVRFVNVVRQGILLIESVYEVKDTGQSLRAMYDEACAWAKAKSQT